MDSKLSVSIDKDELREQIVNLLKGDYACTRVWSAWQYNTMTEEDFVPLEDTERVDEIEALITAQITTLLDKLEQSIKQHTVPEGSHLVTRSYVLNAIKFAKSELTKEIK